MKKEWTIERLKSLTEDRLQGLWANALRRRDSELAQKIESLGVPYQPPSGLKLNEPLGLAMAEIIGSDVVTKAAIAASQRGRPALEVVDRILQAILGDDYETTYESTVQAGYLVTQRMRALGYADMSPLELEDDCVATTGLFFEKKLA